MTNPLHRVGARGGGVTLVGQAIRMVIQLAGVVVLARLLPPEDFGLVAMVAVFMTLADLIRDFGMPSAALQAKTLSQQQASNMFWASVTLATISSTALVASTPLIVMFYGEPRLGQIVPAMAIAILLSGAQAQIQVQLARRMKYGLLAASAVTAPLIGLLAAIAAAVMGWGYWALVLQPVVVAAVLLSMQAASARWIPGLPRRGHGSAALFTSGAHLGAAYALTWAASNADTLVIGARLGATNLGFYNRSFQLTAMPVSSFLSPLTQVALPTLNKSAADGKRPSDLLLRLQFLVAAPVSVLMIGMALTAPTLIPALLGPQWAPAVPVVQILAVGECIHALSFVSYWGFLAERLSKQLLYYNLVTKPIVVALVIAGSSFGVEGVAAGYVVGLAVSWPINLAWLSRTAGYPGMKFFLRGARVLATAAVAFTTAHLLLREPLAQQSIPAAIGGLLIIIFVFPLLQFLFPEGRRDMRSAIRIIRALR